MKNEFKGPRWNIEAWKGISQRGGGGGGRFKREFIKRPFLH